MNAILDELRRRQGGWSKTADTLKQRFEHQRILALELLLGGAVLAWAASQFDGPTRFFLAMASAAMFGVAGFLKRPPHGDGSAQSWVRARAISESLQRLAYTCAARGKGYDDPGKRDAALREAMAGMTKESERDLGHYVGDQDGNTPQADLTPDAYLHERVDRQTAF